MDAEGDARTVVAGGCADEMGREKNVVHGPDGTRRRLLGGLGLAASPKVWLATHERSPEEDWGLAAV